MSSFLRKRPPYTTPALRNPVDLADKHAVVIALAMSTITLRELSDDDNDDDDILTSALSH